MTAPYILPGNERIIAGIRRALSGLARNEPLSRDGHEIVHAMDTLLAELMQREKLDFYASIYLAGHELLTRWNHRLLGEGRPGVRVAVGDLPASPAPDLSFQALTGLVATLAGKLSEATKTAILRDPSFVRDVVDWEERLYATRLPAPRGEAADEPRAGRDPDRLTAYLADHGMRLTGWSRAVGGYQNDTFFLSVVTSDGDRKELVLRADKPDRFIRLDAGSVVDEYEILKAVRGHLPIAEPLWVEPDPQHFGACFLVSERVSGQVLQAAATPGTPLESAALTVMVEALADIHRLSLEAELTGSCIGHWLERGTLPENTRAAVDRWQHQIWTSRIMASPTVTLLLEWLRTHVPPHDGRPVLIHGDFGPQNMLVEDGRVTALLDWEAARFGDPAEDLAYLLLRLGDSVDEQIVIALYERRLGYSIPPESLKYFKIYNRLKMLICCAFAGALYEHDEQAMILWSVLGLPAHHYSLVAAREALDLMA